MYNGVNQETKWVTGYTQFVLLNTVSLPLHFQARYCMARAQGRKRQLDFRQAISELNKSFSLISDLPQLKSNFVARVKEIANAGLVEVFLLDSDNNRFIPAGEDDLPKSPFREVYFLPGDKMVFWLSVNKSLLKIPGNPEVFNFFSAREKKLLEEMKAEIVYPFILMNQVKGFVVLGSKHSGDYSRDELLMFEMLFEQASFAFDNALLYKQQKERSVKMYRADRLATLGELAAGTAHEIRNPLTSIRSTIQYLENKIDDPYDKSLARGLISEVDRINDIIQNLLSFARPDELKIEETDFFELITQIIRLVENAAKKQGISIEVNYHSENRLIRLDTNLIKQALINILMNAIQAIEAPGGRVGITVSDISAGSPFDGKVEGFLLEVRDNGPGIPVNLLEKIFDPFYTTKKEGTGLGLSITYSIINKHGGEIGIRSDKGKGTLVKIKLPVK
jgi:signal transduction histidine kinase